MRTVESTESRPAREETALREMRHRENPGAFLAASYSQRSVLIEMGAHAILPPEDVVAAASRQTPSGARPV
jgi:hypothetical protein